MKKNNYSAFTNRQYMLTNGFEIFYYNNQSPKQVPSHKHDYYELYFFLEGDVDYKIDSMQYTLQYGDYLLIPPGLSHQPIFKSSQFEYRRLVLWISIDFYQKLCEHYPDYGYSFNYVSSTNQYHFRTDFITFQQVQGQLLELLEESNSNHPFCQEQVHLMIATLLIKINRITYDKLHQIPVTYQNTLYLNLCDYINNHLEEDLSLEYLANFFYVSKYHISHIFKDNMGISLHQYVIKKRIHASKNGILSGTPIQSLVTQYGFKDYSSFYRAFKKEYGLSPNEYRTQHNQLNE